MNADFFKDSRPRYNNPTFQSNLVQSTMIFPYNKYQLLHQDYSSVHRNIINSPTPAAFPSVSQNISSSYAFEQKQQQTQEIPRLSSMSASILQEDPYRHRRSKSNLSSYGSSSLSKLQKISDKNVFENQQKDFNIVSLCPKEYKQSIKMFPKFRNQITQDTSHQARKAFISGKPQVGMKYSRLLRSTSQLQNQRNYKSTGKISEVNPENR